MALTGNALAGAQIALHVDAEGMPGVMLQQVTAADADGSFIFLDLAPGAYLLASTMDGYSEGRRSVLLSAGQIAAHQILVLSPLLGPDDIRIVLTWGDHPKDLEAHLTGPNPAGCRHHCNYWNRQIPGAVLDVDDTDAFGPETITLTKGLPGAYRFYVHDFSNRYSNSSMLSTSGATVAVYFGTGQAPATFQVPLEPGTVWHVFDIDGQSGALTTVDRMTFQSEPGEIDFPVITSEPVTTLILGEPYTYQITADDPDPDDVLTFTLLEAPQGMTFDAQTHVLQWDPDNWQGFSPNVTVRVTDGRCGEDSTKRIHNGTHSAFMYVPGTSRLSHIITGDTSTAYTFDGHATPLWPAAAGTPTIRAISSCAWMTPIWWPSMYTTVLASA
jgi:hypothetical protein